MKFTKKVIGELTKCYSIAPLTYQGKRHILIAAEKHDPCYLYDMEGNFEKVVWEEPGGVMTMIQVPGTDGQFLSTHKFFSPNDSAEARLIIATPNQQGGWDIRTLANLPFVHRFGLLRRGGLRYLIASTLKSGHAYKDDWTCPGKVYAAVLPDDLSGFDDDHPLKLQVIQDNMLKNHGYFFMEHEDYDSALLSSNEGVFEFIPPAAAGKPWEIRQYLDTPASDAVLIDLNQDGKQELVVLSPFHGDQIAIYEEKDGVYTKAYDFPEPAPFCHAIWAGQLLGTPAVIVGYRQGKRSLMIFTWNARENRYETELIDTDCGSANADHFITDDGKEIIISCNRELNEIAMYTVEASPDGTSV